METHLQLINIYHIYNPALGLHCRILDEVYVLYSQTLYAGGFTYVCLRHEAEFCESVNEHWGRGDGDSSPANALLNSEKKIIIFFHKDIRFNSESFTRFSSCAVE